MKQSYNHIILLLIAMLISSSSCRNDEEILLNEEPEVEIVDDIEIDDWTDDTHSNLVDPDYSTVFKQNEVMRFDIKISSANWAAMNNDLINNLSSGGGPGGGRPGVGGTSSFDPIWVPCSFYFDDTEWYQVGVRFKGNSSLSSAFQAGIGKLSFKLDFDQYEDEFPQIKNQRFYGFKQLNLKNNFDDNSMVREKVSSDLFREFGLASSQTSFCAVYVDYGSGPKYFGLYSLVEEVDDSVLDSQFADGSGNLYKPDGDAASFASNTYDEGEMEKKNNEEKGDYSDVYALYNVINSSTRTSAPDAWKAELESVLDTDAFLKWLAANTLMQNWDTYGIMTHNYYLYNNPSTQKLTWIPWDGNESLQDGKQGGALSLSLNEVGNNWPLISYLMDVEEYQTQYESYLRQFADEVFTVSKMQSLYDEYYNLLKDYAYAEESGYSFLNSNSDFDNGINTLKSHVASRRSQLSTYLD